MLDPPKGRMVNRSVRTAVWAPSPHRPLRPNVTSVLLESPPMVLALSHAPNVILVHSPLPLDCPDANYVDQVNTIRRPDFKHAYLALPVQPSMYQGRLIHALPVMRASINQSLIQLPAWIAPPVNSAVQWALKRVPSVPPVVSRIRPACPRAVNVTLAHSPERTALPCVLSAPPGPSSEPPVNPHADSAMLDSLRM
jgi:hypothetical protein